MRKGPIKFNDKKILRELKKLERDLERELEKITRYIK